jgi:hypothetical protein
MQFGDGYYSNVLRFLELKAVELILVNSRHVKMCEFKDVRFFLQLNIF